MECKNVSMEFKRFENANSYSMMFFLRYRKLMLSTSPHWRPLQGCPSKGWALGRVTSRISHKTSKCTNGSPCGLSDRCSPSSLWRALAKLPRASYSHITPAATPQTRLLWSFMITSLMCTTLGACEHQWLRSMQTSLNIRPKSCPFVSTNYYDTTTDWFITIVTFTAVAIEAMVWYLHLRLEQ